MKKLELKHLAPYLPCELKVLRPDGRTVLGVYGLQGNLIVHRENNELTYSGFTGSKPILRPLSDLTKEIEVNGEKFVPFERLCLMSDYSEYMQQIEEDVYEMNTPVRWPYEIVEKLFEWHFNVFNLPEHLWVDINTL